MLLVIYIYPLVIVFHVLLPFFFPVGHSFFKFLHTFFHTKDINPCHIYVSICSLAFLFFKSDFIF